MTENVTHEFAEKGAARAKDVSRKAQASAEQATKVMEQTYSATSTGAADFNLHLLEITRANMNAAFDFARQLTDVRSPSEFFELSTAHVRKQVERLSEQTRDLMQLAQKVIPEAGQSFQALTKTFNPGS